MRADTRSRRWCEARPPGAACGQLRWRERRGPTREARLGDVPARRRSRSQHGRGQGTGGRTTRRGAPSRPSAAGIRAGGPGGRPDPARPRGGAACTKGPPAGLPRFPHLRVAADPLGPQRHRGKPSAAPQHEGRPDDSAHSTLPPPPLPPLEPLNSIPGTTRPSPLAPPPPGTGPGCCRPRALSSRPFLSGSLPFRVRYGVCAA